MVQEASDPVGDDPRSRDGDGCRHETLMPRWSGPDAMGDDSRAMGFVCHRCHREFPAYLVEHRRLKHLML